MFEQLVIGFLVLLAAIVGLAFICAGDVIVYRGKDHVWQLNLGNWSRPNWDPKLKAYWVWRGPLLKVSTKLRARSCGRGCCQWVELKDEFKQELDR